jgi:hypothetical protein
MEPMRCRWCGEGELEAGYLEDSYEASWSTNIAWIAGPVQRGLLGGAKRKGRKRQEVDAYRCAQCSHIELFVSG